MTERSCTYLDPHNATRCTECGRDLPLCECLRPDDIAHDRIHSPDGVVLAMVKGELIAARKKFPETTHMLAALTEEVGELNQAMMQHDVDGSQTIAMVLREAVQVACMAIRVATEGDENFAYMFPTVEEELPRGPVQDRF